MRVFRVFFLISAFTLIALIYVHQQIEIVKLSYAIESGEKRMVVLLDQREKLVYNLDHLTSPAKMESLLAANNIKVEYPKRDQVIKVARIPAAKTKGHARLARFERRGMISGMLGLIGMNREAQAKER